MRPTQVGGEASELVGGIQGRFLINQNSAFSDGLQFITWRVMNCRLPVVGDEETGVYDFGLRFAVVERADASLTDWIRGHIQLGTKRTGSRAIQRLLQSLLRRGCNRRVEKAGPESPIDFDDRRDPRCITHRGFRRGVCEVLAKTGRQTPKLAFTLNDETRLNIVLVIRDEELDLRFQGL